LQVDVFIASVAYWLIIATFLLIVERRLSKMSGKVSDIERRLDREK